MRRDEPDSTTESPETPLKIAVAASFTAEPVLEPLTFWMKELGLNAAIEFAPYNQIFQELLNPGSLLSGNRGGINIILLRIGDWLRYSPEAGNLDQARSMLERNSDEFLIALQAVASRSGTPHLVALCPASQATMKEPARQALIATIDGKISAGLEQIAGVTPIGVNDQAAYPVDIIHDPKRDELGHIPYSPAFFAAIGTLLARRIHTIKNPPYKVIALDCDNTIWHGVVGEEGAMGVTVPPFCQRLQQFAVEQAAKGFLVCLCSKNEETDVLEVFDQRTDMPLKRDHLVAWRINWTAKSQNLRSLAQELNLGLDSFVFIDDNPVECAEVQANCPDVLTLQLPPPDNVARFLDHLWAFDRLKVTAEDRQRTDLYKQNAERTRIQQRATSFDDFLRELDLNVKVNAPAVAQVDRVSQLTQRTNQFNFTTIRRTESEIRRLGESRQECRIVEVSDRFGDYGVVGVLIYGKSSQSLEIDTFLLSCRVLGRGVEHQMLRHLGDAASSLGLDWVVAKAIPTAKNLPARQFLDSVASEFKTESEGTLVYRIPATLAATAAPRADVVQTDAADGPEAGRPCVNSGLKTRRIPPYERIATTLYSPAQVLQQISVMEHKRRAQALSGSSTDFTQQRYGTETLRALGRPFVPRCNRRQ